MMPGGTAGSSTALTAARATVSTLHQRVRGESRRRWRGGCRDARLPPWPLQTVPQRLLSGKPSKWRGLTSLGGRKLPRNGVQAALGRRADTCRADVPAVAKLAERPASPHACTHLTGGTKAAPITGMLESVWVGSTLSAWWGSRLGRGARARHTTWRGRGAQGGLSQRGRRGMHGATGNAASACGLGAPSRAAASGAKGRAQAAPCDQHSPAAHRLERGAHPLQVKLPAAHCPCAVDHARPQRHAAWPKWGRGARPCRVAAGWHGASERRLCLCTSERHAAGTRTGWVDGLGGGGLAAPAGQGPSAPAQCWQYRRRVPSLWSPCAPPERTHPWGTGPACAPRRPACPRSSP